MKKLNILTEADINRAYTAIVAHYIAIGYTIEPRDMGGSQGEFAKIDLTKDDDYIRILLDREDKYSAKFYHVKKIIIGRVPENERTRTIWNDHLEVIDSISFYALRWDYDNNNYTYTDDEDYIYEAEGRAKERSKTHCRIVDTRITDERILNALLKLIKTYPGFKRAQLSDISKANRSGIRHSHLHRIRIEKVLNKQSSLDAKLFSKYD